MGPDSSTLFPLMFWLRVYLLSCAGQFILPYFECDLAGRISPGKRQGSDRVQMLKQTKRKNEKYGRRLADIRTELSHRFLLHFQLRSLRYSVNSSHCVFFGKHETAHQWEGTHCYIVVPEQVLSYHVEAEPPPGKVKADISACPSRAVVRYHSIFISTIVRVPAGV